MIPIVMSFADPPSDTIKVLQKSLDDLAHQRYASVKSHLERFVNVVTKTLGPSGEGLITAAQIDDFDDSTGHASMVLFLPASQNLSGYYELNYDVNLRRIAPLVRATAKRVGGVKVISVTCPRRVSDGLGRPTKYLESFFVWVNLQVSVSSASTTTQSSSTLEVLTGPLPEAVKQVLRRQWDDPDTHPTIVPLKLFQPDGGLTWYVYAWDGNDTLFAYVTGGYLNERGTVSIRELRELRGRLGLSVERDLYFRPCPLNEIDSDQSAHSASPPPLGRGDYC